MFACVVCVCLRVCVLQLTEGQDAMLDMLKRSEANHQRFVGGVGWRLNHSFLTCTHTNVTPLDYSSYTAEWRSSE